MSIKRIGKTWYIDIQLPNGERLRQSTKTTDRRRAQQLHDRIKHEAWDRAHLDKGPDKTWGEAVAEYKRAVVKKSAETDGHRFKRLSLYIKDNTQLSQINQQVVQRIREGEARAGKSPATVNRVLSLLSAVLTEAMDWGWIQSKPLIRMRKESNTRDCVLTEGEESRLLNELPDYLRPAFRFALCTGMRQSNVFQLRWEQVNEELATVSYVVSEMKNDRAWTRALDPQCMASIRNQRGNKSPFVFTRNGHQIKKLDNKSWKRWCRKAGVEGFTWHGLRHTWATRFMRSGGSILELVQLGGWSDPSVPMKRYAHLDISDQRRALERTSQKLRRVS
jgi:integrase